MKKILICVITIVLLFLLLLVINPISKKHNLIYTEDIGNYNSNEYPIYSPVFPQNIPLYSKVVSFSYYSYWHEAQDIYLELKFETIQDIDNYLASLKENCLKEGQTETFLKGKEPLLAKSNIYEKSFNDLFYIYNITSKNGRTYTGYEVELNSEIILIDCNFSLISYSYEELTVVHTYVYGCFQNDVHNYIPKYFIRFQIPTDKDHKAIIYLD